MIEHISMIFVLYFRKQNIYFMKKILTLTFCILSALMSFAQDSYHQKVMQLIMNDESMEQAKQLLAQRIPAELQDSLLASFDLMQPLVEKIAGIYEESMRKYMTEADLDWLIEWSNSPRTKEISQKSMQLAQRLMQQDPAVMQLMTELTNGITQLAQNQKPANLQKAEVSKAYRKAFHKYYTGSDISSVINTMFDAIGNMFAAQLGSDGEQLFKAMSQYLTDNMEEFTLRLMSDILTIDDLNYYTKSMEQPAYQHYQQAQKDLISDPAKLMQAIVDILPKEASEE